MAPVDDDIDDDDVVEESGDGWRDLMQGKIKKRILIHGAGPCPEMKQDVICSFEVRAADGPDKPRAEVCQDRKNVRYRIGEGEAIPALELALRYMKAGEESEIYGAANFGWGPTGCSAVSEEEKDIPPDTAVCLTVTLHEILGFPADEAEWNDRIQEVAWRKTNGNDHFRRKLFQKAERCYKAGMEVFSDGFEPPAHIQKREAAMCAAMQLVTDCAANVAAVHLERGDAVAAKEAAKEALMMSPDHVKALYRGAKACLLLDDFEECEAAIEKALKLEPESAVVKRLGEELRRKRQQYEKKSKKVNQRLFEGLDYPDEPPKAKEEVAAPPQEGWLTWLWKEYLGELYAQIDWTYALTGALCFLACLLAILLVSPGRLPYILIVIILGFPVAAAVIAVRRSDELEKKKQV